MKKNAKPSCIEALVDQQATVVEKPGEASQIYGKGFFGTPQSGGSLVLDALEAVYLMEMNRLCLRRKKNLLTMEESMRWGTKTEEGFDVKYLVYREIRQRGYVAKRCSEDIDFRVFPRGGKPGSTPSKYWLMAVGERWILNLLDVLKIHHHASSTLKSLMVGVADEEGDITYYSLSDREHFSTLPKPAGLEKPVKVFMMEDRGMIFDMGAAGKLNSEGWFGQLGGGFLLLSLLETVYMLEKGWIEVCDSRTGRGVSQETLEKRGRETQETFDLRLSVYRDMRNKSLIVKTGFKYGAHFRVYDQHQDGHHARFLVHVLPPDHHMTWSDISRAVRLAHGVKKELLFAVPQDDEKIDYIRVRRVTP